MPPKAKRYRVFVLDPLLHTWRRVTLPLTSAKADAVIEGIYWETEKREVEND